MNAAARTVVLTDPDESALRECGRMLHELSPAEELYLFSDPEETLAFLREKRADLLLSETDMPGLTGFELMEWVRLLQPWMRVVFLTEHAEYAEEAMRRKAEDFLLKPVSYEKLLHALRE